MRAVALKGASTCRSKRTYNYEVASGSLKGKSHRWRWSNEELKAKPNVAVVEDIEENIEVQAKAKWTYSGNNWLDEWRKSWKNTRSKNAKKRAFQR